MSAPRNPDPRQQPPNFRQQPQQGRPPQQGRYQQQSYQDERYPQGERYQGHPPQQGYPQQGYPQGQPDRYVRDDEPRRRSRFGGLAWAAVIIGIIAIVGSIVPFLNNLSAITAVVGIILGIIALFGTRRVLAVIGVGLCVAGIVFTVLAQQSFSATLDEEFGNLGGGPEALADATVTDCAIVDEGFGPSTQGIITITNPTDVAQTYSVTVSVNSPDGARVGEINAFSNSLGAGQSVTLSGIEASGLVGEGVEPGPVACTVASVDRFPS